MTEESISIRSIQHWLYCRHRWGLLEINCAWAENYYVTKANLLHRRVHEDKYHLEYSSFLELKSRLTELIDRDKDSLRFYYLGNNWERRVEHIGAKQTYNPEGVIIL